MRRRRAILRVMLTAALLAAAVTAGAAESSAPVAERDPSGAERAQLRHLHFEFGLVTACGLVDDEVEAGYLLRAGELEQRLGIEHDPDARYRELNLGWTEADADWAATAGPVFLDWCRSQAPAAGDRFRSAFRDTGLTLDPRPKGDKR